MPRSTGLYFISGSFEPRVRAPLDARQRADLFADLIDPSSWVNDEGIDRLFNGLLVSVTEDTSILNGVYRLTDYENFTDPSCWVKLSEGDNVDLTEVYDYVDGSLAIRDASLLDLQNDVLDLSTNKLDDVDNINVTGTSIYSHTTDNIAYLKKLNVDVGLSITDDASSITISLDNVTTYVNKYSHSFDGTIDTSLHISANEHALGSGPLTVTVYEDNQQVYLVTECDVIGNVSLYWAPNSLNTNCRYIIIG